VCNTVKTQYLYTHRRIATGMLTVAAVLLLSVCAFAAEQTIVMAQTQKFPGFEMDNVMILDNIAIWQTDALKKKPESDNVSFKLVKDDSGKFYMDVDNFGRVQVRPLKLIISITRAEDTVSLETGSSVKLSSGGRWKFLGTVRGKKLKKGDSVIIAYDEIDRVHRMIACDDTWQVPVEKQ